MKKLALALVFGMLSVGAVSAQTNQKTKVKTNKNEVKVKSESDARKGQMKPGDGQHKPHKSPEDRAKRRTEKMTSELNLTADQAQQVHQLNLEKARQMQALKERHQGADRSAMGPEMREINQVWQNNLKAALTPDQYTKFQALQAEKKARMQEKRKDGKHYGDKKYKK